MIHIYCIDKRHLANRIIQVYEQVWNSLGYISQAICLKSTKISQHVRIVTQEMPVLSEFELFILIKTYDKKSTMSHRFLIQIPYSKHFPMILMKEGVHEFVFALDENNIKRNVQVCAGVYNAKLNDQGSLFPWRHIKRNIYIVFTC